MKKIIFTVVLTIGIVCMSGCASIQRGIKSIDSELSNGLERTVTVYDYSGNEIKSWTGKFDVSSSENEVYFDKDGKRVIIHGGIVINEEN